MTNQQPSILEASQISSYIASVINLTSIMSKSLSYKWKNKT